MIAILPAALLAVLAPMQDPVQDGPWSGTADAGLSLLSGNNKSITGNFDATAKYSDIAYRWIFEGNYAGVRQTNQTTGDATSTARLYRVAGEHHRFLDDTENLYLYGKASGRSDVPNGLDLREDAGVGLGHTWHWNEDSTEFSLEGGPSVLKENNVGLPSGDAAVNGRAGARLDSDLHDDWKLLGRAEFFQSFDIGDDRSATGEIGLRWSMNSTWHLGATVGVAWDNTPAPGFESTAYRYVLSVGTSF
ncbi:MAG TPA: DUF481 domain-containing protein [Planctomycetota bacterium]